MAMIHRMSDARLLTIRIPRGVLHTIVYDDPDLSGDEEAEPGPCADVEEDPDCEDRQVRALRWNASGCKSSNAACYPNR